MNGLYLTRGLPGSGKTTYAKAWVALYLTRGLPGSGKTTYAKAWVAQDPDNRVRVNRDDLRMMTYGSKVGLSFEQEKQITRLSHQSVKTALRAGKDVIADDMNLRPKYIREWYSLVKEVGAARVIRVEFPLDLDTLIFRNTIRPEEDRVPEAVVRDLYQKYTKKGNFLAVEKYEEFVQKDDDDSFVPQLADAYDRDSDLPLAIIVDIDGTVARNSSGRGWYDWTRVGDDSPIEEITDLVGALRDSVEGLEIIFLSGRTEEGREATHQWLIDHTGIHPDHLYMRSSGDHRDDVFVKSELFDAHVRDRFNVWFVIDDRPKVCRMWRAMGLSTLQVGDPHVEF